MAMNVMHRLLWYIKVPISVDSGKTILTTSTSQDVTFTNSRSLWPGPHLRSSQIKTECLYRFLALQFFQHIIFSWCDEEFTAQNYLL
uniref:Uncharacterized protein n=1 Tax=Pyxicephalus adspersus TaxID=30357 RepID=A0AAV3B7X2_PYXAD|nr:TPA: hypothetical protein GDO54_007632 [Pyxicephalus adspersus]